MSTLTYDDLMDRLLVAVPEMRPAYHEHVDYFEGHLQPHLFFGVDLAPYIVSMLKSDGDRATLKRVFQFLEEMALSPCDRVQNVLATAVCEDISGHSPEVLAKARVYMGEATTRISHEMAVGWGHEAPYDDDPPEVRELAPNHQADPDR